MGGDDKAAAGDVKFDAWAWEKVVECFEINGESGFEMGMNYEVVDDDF